MSHQRKGGALASHTTFLRGHAAWQTIIEKMALGGRVSAAIAYLASDGAELLPLKKGDRLVVDMSLSSVGQGATDPKEVRKLIRRGVEVASREKLHAKFLVGSDWLIVGSMNASKNSRERLDEAAILTTSPAAVREARLTVEKWFTEPVLPDQLRAAIAAYRPPHFKALRLPRGWQQRQQLARQGHRQRAAARLWLIAGLRWNSVPTDEQERAEDVQRAVGRNIRRQRRAELSYIHFAQLPVFAKSLRPGNWAMQIVEGRVQAPARIAGVASYPRKNGKRRWLIVLEQLPAPDVSWSAFRRAAKRVAAIEFRNPRTKAIQDDDVADALLRLWSPRTGKPRARAFNR